MRNFRQTIFADFRWICLAIGLSGTLGLMPEWGRADVTPRQVDAAIDKGVVFLLGLQHQDGSWENAPPRGAPAFGWGAETAIATYALLAAGQSPQSPSIKKAVDWLASEDLHGTYAIGLRSQVWGMLPSNMLFKSQPALAARAHDRDFARFSLIQRGPNAGFYGEGYGNPLPGPGPGFAPLDPKGPPAATVCDRSNSEAAVAGASAVEHAGAEVSMQYWFDIDAAWKAAQLQDGGWNFTPGAGPAVDTITCAGVATLFITQDYLMRNNAHQFDACNGGLPNSQIERGLAWIDRRIAPALDLHAAPDFYALHAIARVGIASGRKNLGNIDWYKTGAELIVKSQRHDGSWVSIHDTSFALLFLAYGHAPVMMTKLQYDLPHSQQVQPWNERPRDVANLARWMGPHGLCSTSLSWQTTTLAAPADDLQDAPILFISGSDALEFNEQEIEKLRTYVEQGGMILGNADCGRKEFADSFMKLGNALFPKYEFRKLPMSHRIFDEVYHGVKWKHRPVVFAMSNGVRELMLIAPDTDMARDWQTQASKIHESSFQLATNIFLYAAGKEYLNPKGETHIVRPIGAAGRVVRIARLKIGDNWDPEPGAWRRLSAILHNERKIDVTPETVKLGDAKLADYKIAVLTGTTPITLDAAQRREIKQFVGNGGTLIIDSAGGGAEFADSAEAALKQIFGEVAARELEHPLPISHAIYTEPKVDEVRYTICARREMTGGTHEPRIRGISVAGGRTGVFFSREDLTAGLVGQPVDGVIGYTPEFASRLMGSMVVYAERQH